MADKVEQLLSEIQKSPTYSPNTKANYTAIVNSAFFRKLLAEAPEEIMERLRTKAFGTQKLYAILLKRLGITIEPVKGRQAPVLTAKPRWDDLMKLLAYLRDSGSPWFPIVGIAAYTGARAGEIAALTPDCYRNGMLEIRSSRCFRTGEQLVPKTVEIRQVPVNNELAAILASLPAEWPREFLIGHQSTALKRLCREAGVEGFTFHTIRSLFAQRLLEIGVPTIKLQRICGWKNLSMAERYLRKVAIDLNGITEGM